MCRHCLTLPSAQSMNETWFSQEPGVDGLLRAHRQNFERVCDTIAYSLLKINISGIAASQAMEREIRPHSGFQHLFETMMAAFFRPAALYEIQNERRMSTCFTTGRA